MPFGGLLTMGLVSAGSSIFGGVMGSSAAKDAAAAQQGAAQQGLDFQKDMFAQQQANQAPYLQAGKTSLASLMGGLENGTFGPGSIPQFQAPSLEDARNSPGYQFAAQQGSKGILQGAAAAGGAITGGTLAALGSYNVGLADQTYGNVFNRALQGYQTRLGRQQQEYEQLYEPARLGQGATQNINALGTGMARDVADLMTQQGNAAAAGRVGSSNAMTQGLQGAFNAGGQTFGLGNMMGPYSPFNPIPSPETNNLGQLGTVFSAGSLPGLGNLPAPMKPKIPGGQVGPFDQLPTP